MGRYKKIAKNRLGAITQSNKTLKDVYNIMISCCDDTAYEQFVNYEIEAVTFKEHDKEIRAFASYIKHVYPDAIDEYIGIDLGNSPSFLVAFWGTLMSGNKPYLINSYYPSELRIMLLNRLAIRLVITNAVCYTDFTVVNIGAYDKNCPQITDEFWQDEFALSSAMTGLEAKICVFNGEAVVNQILNTKDIIRKNNWIIHEYNKRIKVAMILPLFHIFGIMASYFWFAFFGCTMVFLQDNAPETIRRTINRHNVTHIIAPPILFHKLYKGIINGISQESESRKKKFQNGTKIAFAMQNIFPSLGVKLSRRLFREVLATSFGVSPRFMISGGAHIDSEALKIINCIGYPLVNGYGTTETSISGANLAKKISLRTNGSIGHPFESAGYSYDKDGTLIVSGNTICKRIITFQAEESGFNSIKTKDLAKTIKGQHFVVGRKSDLYIGENGENVSPDIIQNELKLKNVNSFCVLEIDGRLSIVLEYGEKLLSAIIVNEIEQVKKALANINYGQHVKDIFITHQPITGPNAIKVSRALLRKRIDEAEIVLTNCKNLKDGSKKQSDRADDAAMLSIKQAFENAVNADKEVQSDSDFFIDLGGSSLDYITLICELEGMFNIKINFENNQTLRTPESFYTHIKDVLL
ncbi:MAG: AMP-binding protein [Oscillospiraceae bacterium]|jgi:acyl carrier protein|nr:AMP-binding protein [Oscillospiraceae bacterium]